MKPPDCEYESPNSTTLIKFPISNGEIHVVKNILYEFHECTTSDYDPDPSSTSSNTNESKCFSSGCHFIKFYLVALIIHIS